MHSSFINYFSFVFNLPKRWCSFVRYMCACDYLHSVVGKHEPIRPRKRLSWRLNGKPALTQEFSTPKRHNKCVSFRINWQSVHIIIKATRIMDTNACGLSIQEIYSIYLFRTFSCKVFSLLLQHLQTWGQHSSCWIATGMDWLLRMSYNSCFRIWASKCETSW